MGGWFSAEFICEACGHHWEDLVDRDLRNEPQDCPHCGEPTKRLFGCRNVMNASYPDGHSRGGEYQDMKEAAKLECQAANLPPEKRGGMNREIRRLREVKK